MKIDKVVDSLVIDMLHNATAVYACDKNDAELLQYISIEELSLDKIPLNQFSSLEQFVTYISNSYHNGLLFDFSKQNANSLKYKFVNKSDIFTVDTVEQCEFCNEYRLSFEVPAKKLSPSYVPNVLSRMLVYICTDCLQKALKGELTFDNFCEGCGGYHPYGRLADDDGYCEDCRRASW